MANIRVVGLTYIWIAFSDPDFSHLELDELFVRGNSINHAWANRLESRIGNPLRVKHLDLGENILNDKAAKEI